MLTQLFVVGAIGLALFFVLWPDRKAAVRMLRRWGVPAPTPDDVEQAWRYLLRRRLWYPPLFIGMGFVPVPGDGNTAVWVIATVMIGGLLAEALALRPPKQPRREALLTPRDARDLVPWWAIALFAGLAVAALLRHGLDHSWGTFAVAAGASAITVLVVAFAVLRPASGTAVIDQALRRRSARVATGLGIATTAVLAIPAEGPWSGLPGLVALGLAWAVLSPTKPVHA